MKYPDIVRRLVIMNSPHPRLGYLCFLKLLIIRGFDIEYSLIH